MFRKGKKKEKLSLYVHVPIAHGIEVMAKLRGLTVTELVIDVLDRYLEAAVAANPVALPEPQFDSEGEFIPPSSEQKTA
jgi:hypothetical protein